MGVPTPLLASVLGYPPSATAHHDHFSTTTDPNAEAKEARTMTNEQLAKLYHEDNMSLDACARLIGRHRKIARQMIIDGGGTIRPSHIGVNKPNRDHTALGKAIEAAWERRKADGTAITGKEHKNWNGGITITCGYLTYTNSEENGDKAGKRVHRLEAAAKCGRELMRGEIVIHLDGDKLNNAWDNLYITNRRENLYR